MASPFVPAQFTARSMPPGGMLKQNAPLHQYHPSQTQNNQCDDAAPSANYPSAVSWTDRSKPSDANQFFYNGPERDGDASEIRKLQEENRVLHVRLAELSRIHQLQLSSLQRQLAEANAARQAAEQRLVAVTTSAQAGRVAANATVSTVSLPPPAPTHQHQPLAPSMQQQQLCQRPPQPFVPQQQYQQQAYHQQQQQASAQSQQHRFHPYARQQPQPLPTPSGDGQPPRVFPHATPAITSQAPPDEKKATGGLFAYCTGFISASLPSSTAGSASVMPSTGIKAAPSWKLFGRSRANEDDEETGRAAPLLPLQTPPTALGGALRDPTV